MNFFYRLNSQSIKIRKYICISQYFNQERNKVYRPIMKKNSVKKNLIDSFIPFGWNKTNKIGAAIFDLDYLTYGISRLPGPRMRP